MGGSLMEARRVEIKHAHRTHAHVSRDCDGSAIGDDDVVGDGIDDGTHESPPLRLRAVREVKKTETWPLLRVAKLQNYSSKLEIYPAGRGSAIESDSLPG